MSVPLWMFALLGNSPHRTPDPLCGTKKCFSEVSTSCQAFFDRMTAMRRALTNALCWKAPTYACVVIHRAVDAARLLFCLHTI